MDNPVTPGTPVPPTGGHQPGDDSNQQNSPVGQNAFPQPQGGGNPLGGAFPQGGQPLPVSPQPQIPQDPNARVGQLKTRGGHIFVIPPHPNTTFDEEHFLTLLEGSISLTMEEKQRVIDAIPQLRIEQINELISIFEEEKQKFSELESEFADDVQRLKQEREKEIEVTQVKKEEESEDEDAKAEAEALRRSLLG